jgi:hypothetical protein
MPTNGYNIYFGPDAKVFVKVRIGNFVATFLLFLPGIQSKLGRYINNLFNKETEYRFSFAALKSSFL